MATHSPVAHRVTVLDDHLGKMMYRGHAVDDLVAERRSFEDVMYLLWHGVVPGKTDLDTFRQELSLPLEGDEVGSCLPLGYPLVGSRQREVDIGTSSLYSWLCARATQYELRLSEQRTPSASGDGVAVMRGMFRAATSDPYERRHTRGVSRGRTDAEGQSLAEKLLNSVSRYAPRQVDIAALNACMVVYADHGLAFSTVSARNIVAAGGNLWSALGGAVAAWGGTHHGGVIRRVADMLDVVGSPANAADYVMNKLSSGERVPGFGHRIFKQGDPRVSILKPVAEGVCDRGLAARWHDIASTLERQMEVSAGLKPNGDLYVAPILCGIGVPRTRFVSLIALARTAGWIAHIDDELRSP